MNKNILIFSIFCLITIQMLCAGTIYVQEGATGAGSGWSDAYGTLQEALSIASSGDEIRVAQGTYLPDTGGLADPREATFAMINGVALKGGYAGFGEPAPDARNIRLYETILSGDLNENDDESVYVYNLPTDPTRADNIYHVVSADFGINSTAVLDGFTIEDGHANGSVLNGGFGGGMCILDGSSPSVLNCAFIRNCASKGGGMFIDEGSTSIIKNCRFIRNAASINGAGIRSKNECDISLFNCIFFYNWSDYGAGMFNYGGDYSRQTLTNCIFYKNRSSSNGGAIYNSSNSIATMTNCIIWGNTNSFNPGESSQIYVYNDDCIDINYSCIENMTGALGGVGNIDQDPMLVWPIGPDGNYGTYDDDFRLSVDSPCIDAGDNSAVTFATDISGNSRIVGTVDMGVYEFQGMNIIYVDDDASGDNNGQSWEDAYTNLTYVLDIATYGDEIRVAQGTYLPDTDGLADPREATFTIINGIVIKGGYAGFGAPDPDARDIELYETILSGDLNGDDVQFANAADLLTEPTRAENCYHVLTSGTITVETYLDGLTITAGNVSDQPGSGGGLYCYTRGELLLTINGCTFRANSAGSGGGIFVNSGHPTLNDCKFIGNAASGGGGAIDTFGGRDILITDCTYSGNYAGCGGAMSCFESVQTYVNCIFSGNTSIYGAVLDFIDGGIYTFINCTIVGNSASQEGAVVYGDDAPRFRNCILWGNRDINGISESGFVSAYSAPDYSTYDNCCVQGWTGNLGGTGTFDADPLFVDPNGPDGILGSEDDDLRLCSDSLCIDAGDNSVVTEGSDLDGNQRIVNNDVDMGAYEFQGIIYVDDNAPGDPAPGDYLISDPEENGTQAHPFDEISEAVASAKEGHKIMVLPGSYFGLDRTAVDKNVTITSVDPADWDVVNDTVITDTFVFSGTEDPNCILTGFKFQGPDYGSIRGNGTHAQISNCIFSGNGPCLATVIGDCDGLIENCLITDNTTFAYCGVLPVIFECNGVIRNCTIANNISGIGDWSGGSMNLENCIIYNNGDIGNPQVSLSGSGTLDISYCDIQGGLQGIDSDGDVNWGHGNIDVDPEFVRWGLWDMDTRILTEGNYHLQSAGWRLSEYELRWTYDDYSSRCIDAGNPGSPLGNELMSVPGDLDNEYGINKRINMGSYGGTAQASMAPYGWALLSDLTNDGVVNLLDFSGQTEDWLTVASFKPGDLNRDGIVNMTDLTALAEDWLDQTDWAE